MSGNLLSVPAKGATSYASNPIRECDYLWDFNVVVWTNKVVRNGFAYSIFESRNKGAFGELVSGEKITLKNDTDSTDGSFDCQLRGIEADTSQISDDGDLIVRKPHSPADKVPLRMDQSEFRQIPCCTKLCCLLLEAGAAHWEDTLRQQRSYHISRPIRLSVKYTDVDIFGAKVEHLRGRYDLYIGVRVLCQKIWEAIQKPLFCKTRGRSYSQLIGVFLLHDLLCRIINFRESRAQHLQIAGAGVGDGKAAAESVEQFHPKMIFQLSDLMTDSGRGQMKLLSCVFKTLVPRRGFEGRNSLQRRPPVAPHRIWDKILPIFRGS